MGTFSAPGEPAPLYRRPQAATKPRGHGVSQLYPHAHLQAEMQVTLDLDKGEDALDTRIITFAATGGSLQVGRASKTEKKQLIPAQDNMWLSNPVISRYHALLSVEEDDVVKLPNLYIEDSESSHGTFVNNHNIKAKGKTQLKTGDSVQFGDYVLRGAERFEPPTFKVQIKNIFSETALHRPSTGRSYSVPDETDDESEMDESHSEASSDESHSSLPHWGEEKPADVSTAPGSSMNNPFTIDDDFVESNKIVIEEVPSRGASEEYDPEENVAEENVVEETWFDEVDAEVESEDEDETSETHDSAMVAYAQQLNGLEFMSSSPIYRPASPLRRVDSSAFEFTVPPLHHAGISLHPEESPSYSQGPFAQPPAYNTNDMVCTLPAFYAYQRTRKPANFDTQSMEDHIEAEASAWAAAAVPPPPVPQSPGLKHTLHTTITTQDFLDNENFAERTRANKENMSIKSLINPPAVAGAKRKADDISDDEDAYQEDLVQPENETEDEMPLLDITMVEELSGDAKEIVTPLKESKGAVVEVVEVEEVHAPAPAVKVVEGRPAKRIRTIASHLGSFALGGVATLAGLACLPDNFFNPVLN